MFILLMTLFSVTLLDGTVVPLVPPKTAVIASFNTLKDCEDSRIYVTPLLADDVVNKGEFILECKEARKPQRST